MSKVLTIAEKTLRESLRMRRTLVMGLGLPVAFMVIFGFAFGGEDTANPYRLAVLNLDEGIPPEQGGNLGSAYLGILANLTRADGATKFFVLDPVTTADAGRTMVRDRDASAFVVIPANFSESIAAARPRPPPQGGGPLDAVTGGGPSGDTNRSGPTARVEIVGDPQFVQFGVASQVAKGVLDEFVAEASASARPVEATSVAVTSSELTDYDFIAPGLMIFSILSLAPQAAAILAKEVEQRTLDRLRLTRMRGVHLLAGVTLAQMVVSVLAILLMFASAYLMGFHNQGGYLPAVLVAVVAALAVMGIAMVIAAFAKTQQDAANFGVLVSVPASFLSGAFFPIPDVLLFPLAGRWIQIYDILPTTHAVAALRQVMTLGEPLAEVQFELAAMAVLSILYLLAGAALYRRKRLLPE